MAKTSDRRHAELASLSRVASQLINEHLVDSAFADDIIIISHPQSEETLTVRLFKPSMFHGYVHPSEICNVVRYNGAAVNDGASLMRIFGKWSELDVGRICEELENSVDNQERAHRIPGLSIDSPPIDWELSLVDGHAEHPWNKCRYPVVGDFSTAKIHFVAMPRREMNIVGDYDRWIRKIMSVENVGVDEDHVILPVHERQMPVVLSKFPTIHVMPQTIVGRPQISLRTISVPTPDVCIKIPLALKVTSRVRTIHPWAITIGHRLEPILPVVEKAAERFGGSLIIAREYAAAASQSEHLGCIIRESTESQAAKTGDRIIVCSALAENIETVWDGTADKSAVLREYCSQLYRAVLPSIFLHGFALQAHAQNMLVRLHPVTRAIHGFVARDLGSFKVHTATFLNTTSLDIDTSRNSTDANTLEDVYNYIHSPIIQGNVAYIIRALKLGMAGWRIAREEMEKIIPPADEMARRVWLDSPTCISRAHVSMQLFGVESDRQFMTIPNLLYHCQFKS